MWLGITTGPRALLAFRIIGQVVFPFDLLQDTRPSLSILVYVQDPAFAVIALTGVEFLSSGDEGCGESTNMSIRLGQVTDYLYGIGKGRDDHPLHRSGM